MLIVIYESKAIGFLVHDLLISNRDFVDYLAPPEFLSH